MSTTRVLVRRLPSAGQASAAARALLASLITVADILARIVEASMVSRVVIDRA